MASLFDTNPTLPNRYNNPEAKTVGGMLRTVECVDDQPHTEIDYDHHDRLGEIAARVFSNPNKLKNPMDYTLLLLYLMEFLGEGYNARNDPEFVKNRMMQLLKRKDSRYENVVLIMFSLMSKNNETFKEKVLEHRRKANEFWKRQFVETSQTQIERRGEKICFKGIVDEYRWHRIDALKNVYGDEWTNWIWRILDIDEIGKYFYATVPTLIKIENEKFKNTRSLMLDPREREAERGFGNFGNCPAYLN